MTNSRDKGARGERELASELRKYGYNAHRGTQYKGSPDSPDVEHLNLYDAIAQATRDAGENDLPAVFHRKNNCPWLVTMKLEEWMKIFRIFELYKDEEDGRD